MGVTVAVSVGGCCVFVGKGVGVAAPVGTAVGVAGSDVSVAVTVAGGDEAGVGETAGEADGGTVVISLTSAGRFPGHQNKPHMTAMPTTAVP